MRLTLRAAHSATKRPDGYGRATLLRFALLVLIVAANIGIMFAGVVLSVGDHLLGYLLLFAPPVISGHLLAARGRAARSGDDD